MWASLFVFDRSIYSAFTIPKVLALSCGLGLILIFIAFKRFVKEHRNRLEITLSPFFVLLSAFVILSGISALLGIDGLISFWGSYALGDGLGVLILGYFFFILLKIFIRTDDLHNLVKAMVLIGALMGVYGTLQFFGLDFTDLSNIAFLQTPSLAGNSNFSANALSLFFPFSLYLFFKEKKKVLWGTAILFIGIGIFFCRSRAVWMATGLSIIVTYFLLLLKNNSRFSNRRLLVTILLALIQFTLFSFFLGRLGDPLSFIVIVIAETILFYGFRTDLFKLGSSQKVSDFLWATCLPAIGVGILFLLSEMGTLWPKSYFLAFQFETNPRFFLARDAFNVIKDNFWPGTGQGVYRAAFTPHMSVGLSIVEPNSFYDHPHNNYLFIWATRGILGFLIFLGILILALKRSYKMAFQNNDTQARALGVAFLMCYLTYCFWSFSSVDTLPTSILFFFILALLDKYTGGTERRVSIKSFFPLSFIGGVYIIFIIVQTIGMYQADKHFNTAISRQNVFNLHLNKLDEHEIHQSFQLISDDYTKAINAVPWQSYYYAKLIDLKLLLMEKTRNPSYLHDIDKLLENGQKHAWEPLTFTFHKFRYQKTKGDLASVLKLAQELLNLAPNNTIVLENVARLYLALHNPTAQKNAQSLLEHWLLITPNDHKALSLLVEVFIRNNRPDKAIENIDRLIKMKTNNLSHWIDLKKKLQQ